MRKRNKLMNYVSLWPVLRVPTMDPSVSLKLLSDFLFFS